MRPVFYERPADNQIYDCKVVVIKFIIGLCFVGYFIAPTWKIVKCCKMNYFLARSIAKGCRYRFHKLQSRDVLLFLNHFDY